MFPSIYVELTSVCNMACDFCGNRFMNRGKKHMEFDMFTNIIDQIVENNLTKDIKLAAIGESLLYPKLFEAIRYCKERKLVTSIITNSLTLTTDLYQKLADVSGLREVQISLHDLTPESFVYRHAIPGISYSSFLENILRIIDYHVGHKIKHSLVINLLFSKDEWISSELWDLEAIKENTRNVTALLRPFIGEMNRIAGKNNIKCHLNQRAVNRAIRALNIYRNRLLKVMDNVYLSVIALNPQLYNTRKKLSGPLGNRIKLVKKKRSASCSNLGVPIIQSNGNFIPCCADVLEELVMGRVDSKTPLLSIIKGEKYQDLINGFKDNNIIHPICQECKGVFEYKDRFLQVRHLIRTIDPYGGILSLTYASKKLLKRVWWNKLSSRDKYFLKALLTKLRVY